LAEKKKKMVVYSLILFYNDGMRKPSFEQFEATSLYCSKCKAAVPVRKRLLLVLPEGEEYEYLCAYCSSSVGTKIDKNASQIELIIKP
jgi:DNA-directed RNA polymerase subunit RPC12/RpoP